MRIVLVGQPNSGKSTIFNQVAGYKAVTSNFPGTTVKYLKGKVNFVGEIFEIVDLPGTYSLTSLDLAELVSRNYLLKGEADVVINVVDASILSRSLELTIQLLEFGIPLVLCLNFMDEAARKGLNIDSSKLSSILGVPVVECIAVKGIGINKLFLTALKMGKVKKKGREILYSKDVEDVIEELETKVLTLASKLKVPARFLAIKLLENDDEFISAVKDEELIAEVKILQDRLSKRHGKPSYLVISAERHASALNIFEEAVKVGVAKVLLRDKIDSLLMHKHLGYVFLFIFLYGFFNIVFTFGKYLEEPLISFFEDFLIPEVSFLPINTLFKQVLKGLLEGLAGGIGIVLPYLVPFLIGLAVVEDMGYLPRIAFLMDTFLHRVGLHGKSVVPLILGYGCNVPAIMSTRILESERDRFLTATLSTFIPCAARTTIIFGLVAFYIGPNAALLIYLLNILVVAALGKLLSKVTPEAIPIGMVMEVPPYQIPSIKVVLSKTWLRIKDFVVVAWPLLILGSIVLSLLEYYSLNNLLNLFVSPLTKVLDLPQPVGVTLIFGVLRKELALVMLMQALETTNVLTVMSKTQILTFTLFTLFYVPCIATIAALERELGIKKTFFVTILTLIVATFIAFTSKEIVTLLQIFS